MFDYLSLQNNTENPTLLTILVTVLFSFLLASLIVFTYEKTSREVVRPDHFIQAMVLIAIVAATVMQAIGDSLARGLGMLGALAIIRFRTNLRDPRNIVFMFASLAAGIACGVYGFVVAIIGTAGFCLTAFILRLSPFSRRNELIGQLRFEGRHTLPESPLLEDLLEVHCAYYVLRRYRILSGPDKAGWVEYEYHIRLENERRRQAFLRSLHEIQDVQDIRLSFNELSEEV